MTLASGARLGPYEILAPLGAGGMGEVWRARDTRLGREVALKVLPREVAQNADSLRRFEQEARAASALNHANILTVHDVGLEDGTSFLVTELLDGESLRQLVRKGPLPPKRAIELARQIAKGLAAAHEKGIVHRDLKPENLFLTSDGVVKILDFGLARLAPAAVSASQLAQAPTVEALTGDGVILGTVGYMAPEQVRGEAADARADLFAFGCVLYELLAGQRAFRRESAVDTLHAILHDEPPELTELGSTTPPALEDLLRHCLDKRREKRFQSASDLVFALEHLDSAHASILSPPSKARPAFWRPIVLGTLALALLATAVGLFLRNHGGNPTAQPVPNFERIAVLPFETPEASREDLAPIANGLAQALINELSRLPGLRVTPWMTARRYADSELSPTKLADELGVEAFLTIALQPEAERVVADLALVEGKSGLQVWGEQLSAQRGDPVSLRSLIAKAAANALRPQLSQRLAKEVSRPVSANPEAYRLALSAASLLDVPSRESLEAAESLLRRALSLDPNLALAIRARGELEFDRHYYGWDGDRRNLELAQRFFEEAIEADPDDPLAYQGLIEVHWIRHSEEDVLRVAARLKARGLDSAENLVVFADAYRYVQLESPAEELFRRTLVLDPANERALGGLFAILSGTPEGTRLLEELLAKYGETARGRSGLGTSRLRAGDLAGAEADFRRALELAPDDWAAYPPFGVLLAKAGKKEEARAVWRQGLERARKSLETSPRSARIHRFLMDLAALLGDREIEEREERFLSTSEEGRGSYWISRARAILGDHDEAVALALERVSEGRLITGFFSPHGPDARLEDWGIEALTRHPRFPELVARYQAAQAELLARYPID